MKKDIHPEYFVDAKVTCSCGKSFTIGSTQPKLGVEICSNCHPFYTGKEKLIDTAGNVERFRNRREKASTPKAEKKPRVKKTK